MKAWKGAHAASTQKQHKVLLIAAPVHANTLPRFPRQQQHLSHGLCKACVLHSGRMYSKCTLHAQHLHCRATATAKQPALEQGSSQTAFMELAH